MSKQSIKAKDRPQDNPESEVKDPQKPFTVKQIYLWKVCGVL